MNASKFFAVAALVALGCGGAYADEAEGSQFVLKYNSTRSRAEIHAEVLQAVKTGATPTLSYEPRGSRVIVLPPSTQQRATVRAEAAQALRRGLIPHGEANFM